MLRDPSLGQAIEVIVKKLVILEQPDPSLRLVPNVDLSAKRFIRWKKAYEKKEGERYDLSLLLTRYVSVLDTPIIINVITCT